MALYRLGFPHQLSTPDKRETNTSEVVASLLAEGRSPQDIAIANNIKLNTVYQIKHRLGLTDKQKHNRMDKARWIELLARLKSGETVATLAKEYNVALRIVTGKQCWA